MSRARTADPAATEVIDTGGEPGGTQESSPRSHRRRSRKKIFLIVGLVLVLLVGGSVLGVGLYLKSVESSIDRVDAFEGVPEQSRPQKDVAAKGALDVLILGSDSRDQENTGGSRTDTIILAHLNNNRDTAQLTSIPRDTWVHVPKSKEGRGGVDAKINAAFAWGGIPLMVQTVEEFTGIRIDHVAIVDFAGFKEIVDALGGIELDVEEGFTSTHSLNPDGKRTFAKGKQTMDGAAALDYARERYALKDGDFGRIRHQQQVIKAILDKASSGGMLGSPTSLNAFLRSTADAVSLDETLNIFTMAPGLRHLRGNDLTFATSPTKGTGRIGDQSVVLADEAKAKAYYAAIRRDALAELPKK